MATYHFTDTLGQAIEEARAASEKANGLFGLLADELAAEREMHRAEVMRLVERAEEAEAELVAQNKRADDRRRELETGLQRAPELPDWVKALDDKLAGKTPQAQQDDIAKKLRRLAEYEKWI